MNSKSDQRHPEIIDVVVNGERQQVTEGTSISALLEQMSLTGPVAVELNGELVKREQHDSRQLAAEATVEIVTLAGGG